MQPKKHPKLSFRGTPRPQVFPFTGGGKKDTRNIGEDVAYTIDANYHKGTNTLEKSRRSVVATYRHAMKGFKGYENISPSIKSSEGSGNQILIDGIRRLTPIECARLQGFPDNWCEGLSDTQAYKCYGNAVTVPVIKDIMERLLGYPQF